jgi:hypothetical protein
LLGILNLLFGFDLTGRRTRFSTDLLFIVWNLKFVCELFFEI